MKYLSFGNEYAKGNWVYPEILRLNKANEMITGIPDEGCDIIIKNDGFKIEVNLYGSNYIHSHYVDGILSTYCEGLGLRYKDKLYNFFIRNSDLLKIMQLYGNGTSELSEEFKFMRLGNSRAYSLIPKNSEEDIFKSEISKVYHDKTIPFTKKMKSGHLYISKTKKLFVCIAPKLDLYLTHTSGPFYSSYDLAKYSKTPRKVKMLGVIYDSKTLEDIEHTNKSLQEFIINQPKVFASHYVYSEDYAGKDLGPYLIDDGRTWKECIMTRKTDDTFPFSNVFLENLILDDPVRRENIKRILKNYPELIEKTKRVNSNAKELFEKLGV